MAYVDDRAWCHPKVAGLTDKAHRAWVTGILYASGMNTCGVLEPAAQRLIGSTAKTRAELVAARLWDSLPGGAVVVHNWEQYNGLRDERKRRDRDRKRAKRHPVSAGQAADSPQEFQGTNGGLSAGQGADSPHGVQTVPARTRNATRARGRAPDDLVTSERRRTRAVTSQETTREADEANSPEIDFDKVLKAVDW